VQEEQKKRNSSWSQQNNRKEERLKRKEKKVRKAKWLREQGKKDVPDMAIDKKKRSRTGTICNSDSDDEWEELAREEKMAKKLRRGEIDQAAFDREFGENAPDDA
jgi:ATP-dependent RNA helicase DDX55/SPB4